jgi:hypothetical protein
MATDLTFDGASPFRIKRPLITTSGFVSDVDPAIKAQLDELNTLLGKRVIHPPVSAASVAVKGTTPPPDIKSTLSRELTPKHTPPVPDPAGKAGKDVSWADDSLARWFNDQAEDKNKLTLSEYIDLTSELSSLKYSFQGNLTANWFNLDDNTKTVLNSYSAISDYLIAYAYLVMGLREVNGLKNFILSNRLGTKNLVNYAIVSTARTIIDKKQIKVAHYNDDTSTFVTDLKAASLSVSAASFSSSLQALIDDHIFNAKQAAIIAHAELTLGPLPAAIKPPLIRYIKNSTIPITNANATMFLPLFLSQIMGPPQALAMDGTATDTDQADQDFDVDFITDDNSMIKISKTAVKCAAQLYYSMVLGDDLDVFAIVNYFTHKYLIRGGIEIQDSRLREDLQQYVFSNRYTDLKTNKLMDRTRPSERQMFYRQVFNYGSGRITEDVIINQEFPRLWKVLILESAKYLERAQAAFNPDAYVSRQGVQQAVEDLQYNLSTHCTGMANVITPMIYSELNFVIRRILMADEIVRQIVPAGGTWWRVVESLYMEMKKLRPKSTVIYNKAKIGHDIIESIADYNPAAFEDDAQLAAFISRVDAFITTQSILQDALTDDLKRQQEDSSEDQPAAPPSMPPPQNMTPAPQPSAVGAAAGAGGSGSSDEWDF